MRYDYLRYLQIKSVPKQPDDWSRLALDNKHQSFARRCRELILIKEKNT
jgi:hypothetical protein